METTTKLTWTENNQIFHGINEGGFITADQDGFAKLVGQKLIEYCELDGTTLVDALAHFEQNGIAGEFLDTAYGNQVNSTYWAKYSWEIVEIAQMWHENNGIELTADALCPMELTYAAIDYVLGAIRAVLPESD